MFARVFALSLAVSGVFADCALYARPTDSELVTCNAPGTVIRSPEFLERSFYAPKISYCDDKCQSDTFCVSFSYNKDNGECRLLNDQIFRMGFKKNQSSPYILNSVACYEHVTGCGLQNPSFEIIVPRKTGIRYYPTNKFIYPSQPVAIVPWTQYNNNTDPKSFVKLNTTGGAASGQNFAEMSVFRNEQHYLGQRVILFQNRTYQYSFAAKYIGSQGNPGFNRPITYYIRSEYDTFIDHNFTIEATPASAAAGWRTFSGTLVNPPGPYDRTFAVAVQARSHLPESSDYTSLFGFDSFTLEEVQT